MSGSSIGRAFVVTTAGESHGPGQVVIIDGCPPGLKLTEQDIVVELERRRPGQSKLVTQRKEPDVPEILSGVFEGKTTGTPIAILVRNQDARSKDYSNIKDTYRPGHADYSFDAKFGFRDYRGGGRSSARETTSRVAAGAIAKKLLKAASNIEIVGWVKQVGDVVAQITEPAAVTLAQVEKKADGSFNPTRCPDPVAAEAMYELIDAIRKDQDSIGGLAEFCISGAPAGLGEPVFDKLKADLSKALMSLPAVLGVEYGAGFSAVSKRGSELNDPFEMSDGKIKTRTNNHGGMLGGISTGMPIVMRAAVKPTSSLPRDQDTVTKGGEATTVSTKGRHDPCLLPRFIPMAEAMMAIVVADHLLRWTGQTIDLPHNE